MKLNEVFGQQTLPIKTIQKKEQQRPPLASKFLKKAGKKFVKARGEGRIPSDVKPRFKETIPPTMKVAKAQ